MDSIIWNLQSAKFQANCQDNENPWGPGDYIQYHGGNFPNKQIKKQ